MRVYLKPKWETSFPSPPMSLDVQESGGFHLMIQLSFTITRHNGALSVHGVRLGIHVKLCHGQTLKPFSRY